MGLREIGFGPGNGPTGDQTRVVDSGLSAGLGRRRCPRNHLPCSPTWRTNRPAFDRVESRWRCRRMAARSALGSSAATSGIKALARSSGEARAGSRSGDDVGVRRRQDGPRGGGRGRVGRQDRHDRRGGDRGSGAQPVYQWSHSLANVASAASVPARSSIRRTSRSESVAASTAFRLVERSRADSRSGLAV